MHFVAIFSSGAVFLTGYFTRWHGTPLAMVVCFTALASLCSIETLDFLTNSDRYIRFAQEVFYYVVDLHLPLPFETDARPIWPDRNR